MADNVGRISWLNLTANGNIRPSRVVVGVTGAGNFKKCIEAAAAGTLPPLGIARENTRYPAGSPSDDGYHAIATEPVSVYGPGDLGNAVAGAAITNGSLPLTFDNQGRVVTASPTAGTFVWCVGFPAHTVSNAGEKVEVFVTYPFIWTVET